jgi:hypothetical protein
VDLEELAKRVSAEIDNYVYEYPDGMIGRPLSAETIGDHLQKMRAALIKPYWAEITLRDTLEPTNATVRRCAVVADDTKGTVLAFDPVAGNFLLACQLGDALESFGIDGDAVGCFMAR